MKKSYFILLVLLLQACESPPVRREEMIAENPQWNKEAVAVIRQGFILKGMSTDQVRAAWGRPCILCPGTTKGDWGESWEYQTQIVFFDKQGNVVSWKKK